MPGPVAVAVAAAAPITTFGINLSLIKCSTIIQAIIGLLITSSILATAFTGVTVVAYKSVYEPPIPHPDVGFVTFKTIPIKIDVLKNDIDPKKLNLTISEIPPPGPQHGKVEIIDGKYLIYRPNKGWSGLETFHYTVSNGKRAASSYVQIEVKNHSPEPADLTTTINKNSVNNELKVFEMVDLLGKGIIDVDGDNLTIVGIKRNPEHGEVRFQDEAIFYTPNKEFFGLDRLIFNFTDGNDTVSSTLSINVQNLKPILQKDVFEIPKYKLAVLDVLRKAYDPNGDEMYIVYAKSSFYGTTSVDDDKKSVIYYTSDKQFVTFDSFEFGVSDSPLDVPPPGTTAQSLVLLKYINKPPLCGQTTHAVVYKNATNANIELWIPQDPDGLDTRTASLNSTSGRVRFETTPVERTGTLHQQEIRTFTEYDYTLVYSLPSEESDSLEEEIVYYNVTDQMDVVQCNISIKIATQPPTLLNNTAIILPRRQISSIDVSKFGIILKTSSHLEDLTIRPPDSDEDGVLSWNTQKNALIEVQDHLMFNYHAPMTIENDPDDDFFSFRICAAKNDINSCSFSSFSITLENSAPECTNFSTQALEVPLGSSTNILLGQFPVVCTDEENDDLFFSNLPSNFKTERGFSLTKLDAKTILYTTNTQDKTIKSDSFKIKVSDGRDESQEIDVLITLTSLPPISAENIEKTQHWNSPAVFYGVVEQSIDPNSLNTNQNLEIISESVKIVVGHGATFLNPIRQPKEIGVIPDPTFFQTGAANRIVVQYQVHDPALKIPSNVGNLTIILTNDSPLCAQDPLFFTHQGKSISIKPLTFCSDLDPLFVKNAKNSSLGSLGGYTTKISDSEIKFFPKSGFIGTDKFDFTISDSKIDVASTATVEISNTKPSVSPYRLAMTTLDKIVKFNIFSNNENNQNIIFDADGDTITLQNVANDPNLPGTFIFDSKGNVTFTMSNAQKTGHFTTAYSVFDGAETATSNIELTITNSSSANNEFQVHWRELNQIGVLVQVFSSDDAKKFKIDKLKVLTSAYYNGNTSNTENFIANPQNSTIPVTIRNATHIFVKSTFAWKGRIDLTLEASSSVTLGTFSFSYGIIVFNTPPKIVVSSNIYTQHWKLIQTSGFNLGSNKEITVTIPKEDSLPVFETIYVRELKSVNGLGQISVFPPNSEILVTNPNGVAYLNLNYTMNDINKFKTSILQGGDAISLIISDGMDRIATNFKILPTNPDIVSNSLAIKSKWDVASQNLDFFVPCLDPKSDPLTFSIGKRTPQFGNLTILNPSSGKFRYTYIPSRSAIYTNQQTIAGVAMFSGNETFEFSCSDELGSSSTNKVDITIWNKQPPAKTNFITKFVTYVLTNPQRLVPIIPDQILNLQDPDILLSTPNYKLSYAAGVPFSDGKTAYQSIQISQEGKSILFTPLNTFFGTFQIKFAVHDGNLVSNESVALVEMMNLPPMCNFSAITKNASKTQTEFIWDVVKDALCFDQNEEKVVIDSIEYSGLGKVKKITLSDSSDAISYQTVPDMPKTDKLRVWIADSQKSKTSVDISINISNQPPILKVPPQPLVIPRQTDPQNTYSLDLLLNSFDADGDTLKISNLSNTICFSSKFSLFKIASNGSSLTFVPKNDTYDFSCAFSYDICDSAGDCLRGIQNSVSVIDSLPIATEKLFVANQGEEIIITETQIMAGNYDPNGGKVYLNSTFCENLNNSTSKTVDCVQGAPIQVFLNGERSFKVPTTKDSCDRQRFYYSITKDNGKFAISTVSVKYINCICSSKIDIILVLDASGSISSSNWLKMKSFLKSLFERMIFGAANAMQVAGIQFSSDAYWASPYGFDFVASLTQANTAIDNLGRKSGNTATTQGLVAAYWFNSRSLKARPSAKKVIILVSDGYANVIGTSKENRGTCETMYPFFSFPIIEGSGKCVNPIKTANYLNSLPDWRVVALGVDCQDSACQQQISGVNYDPREVLFVAWEDLEKVTNAIVDNSCSSF